MPSLAGGWFHNIMYHQYIVGVFPALFCKGIVGLIHIDYVIYEAKDTVAGNMRMTDYATVTKLTQ